MCDHEIKEGSEVLYIERVAYVVKVEQMKGDEVFRHSEIPDRPYSRWNDMIVCKECFDEGAHEVLSDLA